MTQSPLTLALLSLQLCWVEVNQHLVMCCDIAALQAPASAPSRRSLKAGLALPDCCISIDVVAPALVIPLHQGLEGHTIMPTIQRQPQ
jgi:hypothetical protein